MPTSSAKPAKLLSYRTDGLAQVQDWEPEVGHLDTALTDLRTALASADLPEDCRVSVLFYEVWFETLTQNQRHLDEWVGDVANEFIEASGGDPATFDAEGNPNLVMTADDGDIVVGFADRADSEAQAEEDAAALDAILGDSGLIHPYELANDPELLERLAEQYPELRDILARSERFATDESYAATLVNTLGPDNVRTMADLTNSFGLAQDQGLIDGDAYLGFVVPFGNILAGADRSGRMDPSVRSAIFDMDATDELDDVGADSIQEQQLRDMRYRSLALLVSVGGYSAQTTADMADEIIRNGPIHPEFYDYSGFTNGAFLQDHQALASNEWSALTALQGDDHAANIFLSMDRDEYPGELENVYIMGGSPGSELAAERLGISPDDARGIIDDTVANVMRGGVLEYPLATGTTYSPETVHLVTETIQAAGAEHVDAAEPVRVALVEISTPYTRDLAITAAGGGPDFDPTRLPDIDRGEIGDFMREVSGSEQARVALSQNAAALVRDEIGGEVTDIAGNESTAFGSGTELSSAYYTEMGNAWDAEQVDMLEQREALVSGWRSVTDPVVDLVSGKIVEKIPVVNVAADLPLVSNVVDGITGGISESINSAVYDNAIPKPELESMQTWSDALSPEVNTAVATGLWENPETQQHFLDQAQQDPDDQALVAQITADGEVTLDEFRQLSDVQDAVNSYGGQIVAGFEGQMAFDKVFPK